MFLGAFTNEDGLPSHHIRNQFMLFTLQGLKNDATNKLQVSHALHMQGMHCMAHWNNIGVRCLPNLEMLARIVTILASLHMYFSKVFKTLFGAPKTCWFNCLSLTVPRKILPKCRNEVDFIVEFIVVYFVRAPHPFVEDVFGLNLLNRKSRQPRLDLVDIKCLLILVVVLPFKRAMKPLVVFAKSPNVYVYNFTRAFAHCIFDVNALRCTENALISNAFSCFKKIKCRLSHEHFRLRWYAIVHDLCRILGFEAHLPISTNSHLNATCIDHVRHSREEPCDKRVIWYNHVRGEGWGCRYMLFVCFVYEKLTFFFVCYLVCNFCFPSTWV